MTAQFYPDPVADGQPSPSRTMYALTLLFLAFGTVRLSWGEYSDGLLNLGIAIVLFSHERNRISQWTDGYYQGFKSGLSQVENELERLEAEQ